MLRGIRYVLEKEGWVTWAGFRSTSWERVTYPAHQFGGFFTSVIPAFFAVFSVIFNTVLAQICVFYICMNTFNTAAKADENTKNIMLFAKIIYVRNEKSLRQTKRQTRNRETESQKKRQRD
jgi:hypothetical protein